MNELIGLLAQHGLTVVFVNVFLTQLGVPLPAVPMLIVAGALVQQGGLSLPALMGTVMLASLLGDFPWYAAGRLAGSRVLNVLCRIAIEPDSCVKQSENIFERWGAPSLLIAKFVPGFSVVAPPVAGALRLKALTFAIYSALGALLWAGVAVATGAVFHAQIDWLLTWLATTGARAATALGAAVGLYLALKWLERYMFIRVMRMARLSVEELAELMQQETRPVILDARSATARRLDPRRIPGAVAVDIAEPERGLSGVSVDRELVVYCT